MIDWYTITWFRKRDPQNWLIGNCNYGQGVIVGCNYVDTSLFKEKRGIQIILTRYQNQNSKICA